MHGMRFKAVVNKHRNLQTMGILEELQDTELSGIRIRRSQHQSLTE